MLKFFACSILMALPTAAPAFDPYTMAMGIDTAEKVLGGAEEAASLGEALTDLMTESEVDENLVKEMEANVKRLEEIQTTVRNTKSTAREIRDFTDFDLSRSKSLASKLKALANKVRQGRRLVGLFSKKQSSTALQIEQVRLNYHILEEMRNLRMQAFNAYLEDKERKAKMAAALEKSLEEERKHREEKFNTFRQRRRGK